ncbi:glycosyl hydrolase family 28-related protein, partial [Burkholderia multivorans]|nr:glycosyl hydrolase family 28-related protein [Burkholderia multivorans]
MKKILLALLAVPATVFGQTYPSPTFSSLTLQNPLTVANGGTGATTATGTGSLVLSSSPTIANPTITGSLGATGLVTTGDLATQAANTIIANATASTASPTAIVIPSCSGATSALGWSSGSGPVCNSSINAATLGGATFASPGPIGSGTASSGAFTTLSASTSNPSLNYLATGTGAVARSYASKFGDVVSAIDFGADPTGTVSSTAAIQAAIDAVTAKGGTVFLPIGTYKMTAPLVFPNAQFVSLIGAGHGAQLVNSTGTSFDMITWTNPGAGNLILTYTTIANLSLLQNGASGSGAEINTQYASGVTIKGVYFGSLATGGDGIKVVGNGSTYSHEIQIIDFSGRSSTGNAVIHLTGTASDNLISGGVYEGMFGALYGIQLDNGVGTLQMQNLHISNFATNVISVGTMVGVLQATNCIFDNATLETAYFNGMTNAVAESIIKCNTPDLPCTRPCRRPMGTRYQHLSAEERATIMIML